MSRGYLLVGGPKAGEQIAWDGGQFMSVAVFKPLQPVGSDLIAQSVETFTYSEIPIRTERGDVLFMVPQGWTPADMFEELTRGYIANAKRERVL